MSSSDVVVVVADDLGADVFISRNSDPVVVEDEVVRFGPAIVVKEGPFGGNEAFNGRISLDVNGTKPFRSSPVTRTT